MSQNILGLGVDVVDVRRIESMWKRHPERFLARLLSAEELSALERERPLEAARLAGRWAAKEAVSKALGSGFRGFNMNDIEIFNDASGMPLVVLQHGAAIQAASKGIELVMLSISHEREVAMAQALALG